MKAVQAQARTLGANRPVRFKRAMRAVVHSLGGLNVFRRYNRAALRILMYHGFPADQAGLRTHCEHIRRFYHPVSMAQVSAAIHKHAPLPENAVAITIDDGYRDFLLNAFPVFRDFEIPATVFVVADFLDRKSWLWWNQIEYAFEYTSKTRAEFDAPGIAIHSSLETPEDRWRHARSFAQALTAVSNSQRLSEMERVLNALEVSIPQQMPEQVEPMSWDEVRLLRKSNIEFGAHTKSHPILSSIDDPQAVEDEIRGSKARVEEELGSRVIHFCYPNGKLADIGAEALRITRACGFETAVTTEPGMNRLDGSPDPLLLRRIGVSPDYATDYFAELLAGVRTS